MRPADNPFRSARMDSVPYRLRGASWEQLIRRVATRRGGWLEVVGPHGSGKTRLLRELETRLHAAGLAARYLRVGPRGQDVPGDTSLSGQVILLDGIERASAWRAFWIQRSLARRRPRAVVVARHEPGRAPRLYTCRTDLELARGLVELLTPIAVPDEELRALLDEHQGNLRGVFRALYDKMCGRTSG